MPVRDAFAICLILTAAPVAAADVVEFDDFGKWSAALGSLTTIGFTEVPHGTFVDEEYAGLGVHFVGSPNVSWCCDGWTSYPNDGAGLDGNQEIHLIFDAGITGIALDLPGTLMIELYQDGQFLFEGGWYGGGGSGFFVGLIASQPFDELAIYDSNGQVNLDDLHFGPPVLAADLDGDGAVAFTDLLTLLNAWGPCSSPPAPCPADIDQNGNVGLNDLLMLLIAWS